MNKVIIGLFVLVIGGVIGWYYYGGQVKLPGMKIGDQNITPAAERGTGDDVTISEESTGTGTEKGGVMGEAVVTYTDNGFMPATITVKKGTAVTFRNESTGGMWTASATHPTHQLLPGFDQKKSVVKGGTYEYTFAKVGTWKYHNHVAASDFGSVTVTE